MMISPEAYLEQMKDATYEQLIKERDGLIRYVRRYEKTEKACGAVFAFARAWRRRAHGRGAETAVWETGAAYRLHREYLHRKLPGDFAI